MKIKIYEINDRECWAGESWESIKQQLIRENIYTLEELQKMENVYDAGCEHSDEYLKKLTVIDETGELPEMTAREYLDKLIADGEQFPCFFVATPDC